MQFPDSLIGSNGDKYYLYGDCTKITCSCPAATYRKGDCKHVKKWKADHPDWQSTLPLADDDFFRDAKYRFLDG